MPQLPEVLKNFVDGDYVDSDGATRPVVNPATGKTIYHIEIASDDIVERAFESAVHGQKLWAAYSQTERSRILLKAVTILRERNDELARYEVLDTAKPWQEASVVDVASGADAIEYFANVAQSHMGVQQPVGDDFFYTRQEPVGVCVGIGAWNYPLQIACWKAGPALACGNSMVFKPSEETPHGAVKLAEIFVEAGVPAGVFNVVHGDGVVGEKLTGHSSADKVSFTGEVSTGKKVMANAASSLKSVTMELGGKSPLIIFEDACIDDAVSAAMLGNFYTQGEICTNGTRVFVHQSRYDEFIDQLLQRVKNNIQLGDPLCPATNMGALISQSHLDKVQSFVDKGIAEGATLLIGGNKAHVKGFEDGYFYEPTVFVNCHDDMQIAIHEIFGPVMTVLTFEDEDEVVRRANNTKYGLAAGVFTQNIQLAHRVIAQLQAGICWINAYGNSPVEMPVGGYKLSGLGRENGVETLNAYTQTKSIYVGMTKIQSPF